MHAETIGTYLVRVILDHYIAILLSLFLTPAAVYAWKWALGDEEKVKNHRVRFLVVLSVLGVVISTCILGAIEKFRPNNQSPDFRF